MGHPTGGSARFVDDMYVTVTAGCKKQDIINSMICLFLSVSIAVLCFSCSVSAVKQQDAVH
jgi:hypothetical protein